MIKYVPDFILQNYEQFITEGIVRGYVLLVDIAGFTEISTTLQKEGNRGVEELSRFLDDVFRTPINTVVQYGGFVSVFAGDAFCSIFPDAKDESIISTVNTIKLFFEHNRVFKTPFGNFDLRVRQTICFGDIKWQIFENDVQNEYVFYGDAIQQLGVLSSLKKETIFSYSAAKAIGLNYFEKLDTGYLLRSKTVTNEYSQCPFQYDKKTKDRFLRSQLRREIPVNEIRPGAFCFINLENIEYHKISDAIAKIENISECYSGYVNKLDATDKGLTAIILFGIPTTQGYTLDQVCSFSLNAVSLIPNISLGISCGNVFAGYTGGSEIKEYTALGHPVNIAARLMGRAKAGEILTDNYLYQHLFNKYRFQFIDNINLKGISKSIKHFCLLCRAEERLSYSENTFVGRDRELTAIRQTIADKFSISTNSIIYVLGNAGVGKSRLIKEALRAFPDQSYHKFSIHCDAMVQKPLEPIKQLVRDFFYSETYKSMDEKISIFREKWRCFANDDPELLRIESIIAYLLGYEWERSIWSVLPHAEKPKHLKEALFRFIQEIAKDKPVLLHLDDGQWIDLQSKEYLQYISEKKIYPVMILTACRYPDNGEKVDLELLNHHSTIIDLSTLSEDESSNLIKSILKIDSLPKVTFDAINSRAMGNPLFIDQLISFLLENHKIDHKGAIIEEIDTTTSFSISDIIGSRIDRLTQSVRECISHASVLGMEFNIKLLSKMLTYDLHNDLVVGERNRIWTALDELRYIFSHILIKDIAYNRIMSSNLQKLHIIAGESMEMIYIDRLEEFAEDIANHFEKGKTLLKAADYYSKAGCWYRKRYIFDRAEALLARALQIRETVLSSEHLLVAETLNNLADLHYYRSDYEKAENLYFQCLTVRKKNLGLEHLETAHSLCNLGNTNTSQGKFELAESRLQESLDIRKKILGTENSDTATSINNLALLYHTQGKDDEAIIHFQQALNIFSEVYGEDHPNTALAMYNLAYTYKSSDKQKAEKLYLRSLDIRERVLGLEHPDTVFSMNGLALFYHDEGDYNKAEPLYSKALEIRRKVLGNEHSDTAISISNIARLYCSQGAYNRSEELFKEALTIQEKVLSPNHLYTAHTMNNIADLYYHVKKYIEAEIFLIKALKVYEDKLGVNNHFTANAFDYLAYIYEIQNKYQQAEPLLIRYLEYCENEFGSEHTITKQTLERLEDLYKNIK